MMKNMSVLVIGDNPEVQLDSPNVRPYWNTFTLGGRWARYFKLREGRRGMSSAETCPPGLHEVVTDSPGVLQRVWRTGWACSCRKEDIDFDGMRLMAADLAAQKWLKATALLAERGCPMPKTFDAIRVWETSDTDAHNIYWNQPGLILLAKEGLLVDQEEASIIYNQDEGRVRAEARETAIFTHAVVREGKWSEPAPGENLRSWASRFSSLFDSLSDETLMSVFDCAAARRRGWRG